MVTEGYDQWIKSSKNLGAPLNEWNKATTELCHRITQQNLELLNENFARVSDQMKRFASVRKPEDLINLQKDCVNEDITATIESMQKIIHTTMEGVDEFTKICSSSMRDSTKSTERSVK